MARRTLWSERESLTISMLEPSMTTFGFSTKLVRHQSEILFIRTGNGLSQTVRLNCLWSTSDSFCMNTQLYVSSYVAKNPYLAYGLHECLQRMDPIADMNYWGSSDEPLGVINIALESLVDPDSIDGRIVLSNGFCESIDEWKSQFCEYGIPYFDMTQTSEKLANYVIDVVDNNQDKIAEEFGVAVPLALAAGGKTAQAAALIAERLKGRCSELNRCYFGKIIEKTSNGRTAD